MSAEHSERTVSKVRDLAAKGVSARVISEELAVAGIRLTRNAVIGITHRRGIALGLVGRPAKVAATPVVKLKHPWDVAQTNILRDGWTNGATDNEISARILAETGVYRTKNAIHGRAAKISLPKKTSRLQPRSKMVSAIIRAFPPEHRPIEAPAGGVCLMDIGPDQCRWVIGNSRPALMCGAGVSAPGSAWCSTHRSIVYVPRGMKMDAARKLNTMGVVASRGGNQSVLLVDAFVTEA